MGLLGDIFESVAKEAKSTLKSEIRSEVNQETRKAVRGTIEGAKQGIGQVADNVKKSTQKPQTNASTAAATSTVAPAGDNNVGEAMADATAAMQPLAQMMNQALENPDSVQGKLMNALVSSKLTDDQKAEMKESLATLSDTEKVAEAQKMMVDNSAEIEQKLREAGIDPEALKSFLNQGVEAGKNARQ